MPWVVGIDEAGYGPNLGPLVQAAVAVRLPDHDPAGWETLKPYVRRCCDPDDGRLLIDDSKKVYAGGDGFARLERTVFSMIGVVPQTAGEFFRWRLDSECRADLEGELGFAPTQSLPLAITETVLSEVMNHWMPMTQVIGGSWLPAAVVVPATRFNRIVDDTGTKAAVLARGLIRLLGFFPSELGRIGVRNGYDDPIVVWCDKLGGRNYYAAMLQDAFPDGWVVALKESAAESRYRVANLDREIEVVFRPRADAESVAVALASMTAKYLREVCMIQFNAFWAKHVPGLKPTAGYPGDAKRFYDAIRPVMARLGIPDDAVWRKK